ncbi:MAG: ATP-binding protein [Candidatus Peribacteraceae bacterium]|nr:ATP-binding protein [Candidatus Peribacteraceae bacterium]
MKTVVILSGKGGVGKSTIVASLAVLFSKDHKIICADCDVDASNLSLVLGVGTEKYEEWKDVSTNEKAVFDLDKCNSCKKCFDACYFNAIDWKNDKPILKEFSCEGCTACKLVCPQGAITMEKINNAKIGHAKTKYGFRVVSAQLNPGESGSGKVVSTVKKKAKTMGEDSEILLVDSAAGIGCPVIASVTGSDYAVIVTEPTPSGFSDMKKAFEVINHFRIPCGIVINKYDINKEQTEIIEKFAKDSGIEIIGKIPFDKKFAKALTEMIPIVEYEKGYTELFEDLKKVVLKAINF